MKEILLLTAFAGLLSDHRMHLSRVAVGTAEHARYDHHDEVIVGPPVVVVRPPEVVVRPPEVMR